MRRLKENPVSTFSLHRNRECFVIDASASAQIMRIVAIYAKCAIEKANSALLPYHARIREKCSFYQPALKAL